MADRRPEFYRPMGSIAGAIFKKRRADKNNSFCTLLEPEQIPAEEAAVNFSDMFGETQLFYTPDEYRRHLLGIIRLLESYPDFSVYVTDDRHLEGVTDVGVLVAKTLLPSVIFAINENNMTTAFGIIYILS